MDFVAEINALITMAAELPKDGVAVTPFRNGLARLKKSLSKELETLDTRLREMEADSKDTILAKENDRLSAQLHEAREEIERLKYDLAQLEKQHRPAKEKESTDEIRDAILLFLLSPKYRGGWYEPIASHIGVSEIAAGVILEDLEKAVFIYKVHDGGHWAGRFAVTPQGKRYLFKRGKV